MKISMVSFAAVILVVIMVVAACGGSGGGGGGGTTPSGKVVLSVGAMEKGSVTVNGVKFEDTAANITGDDTAKTPADLKDGMVVKVKGTRNEDGVTGTAERIEIENEIRGAIWTMGTGTFSLFAQTVIVSSQTVSAGGWSYSAATGVVTGLAINDYVEVHGTRNAAGEILASRVEKFGAAGVDELRGVVSNLSGTLPDNAAFEINGYPMTTNGTTTIVPAGATVANGALVEVHLSSGIATRIEVEHAEDAEFEPSEGQEVEVEGYIANYDNISDFEISGQHVHLSASTRYEGGIYADLANNVKVEAEGNMSSGILIADKIKFKDTIRFEANADAKGSAGVLGRTIYVVASTEYKNLASAATITGGDGLRVRGYLNSDGSTITATRVEKLSNPVATDKIILQGPVSAKDEANKKLTILGITVELSSTPASEIKDDNDNIITLAQFYASITLNRTAVKVRGSYSAGNFTADKAEIE